MPVVLDFTVASCALCSHFDQQGWCSLLPNLDRIVRGYIREPKQVVCAKFCGKDGQ